MKNLRYYDTDIFHMPSTGEKDESDTEAEDLDPDDVWCHVGFVKPGKHEIVIYFEGDYYYKSIAFTVR